MTMDKLIPEALASAAYDDDRAGVQAVSEEMILEYVMEVHHLPEISARPFASWLDEVWYDFNEDGEQTNGGVINGAVAAWTSGKTS